MNIYKLDFYCTKNQQDFYCTNFYQFLIFPEPVVLTFEAAWCLLVREARVLVPAAGRRGGRRCLLAGAAGRRGGRRRLLAGAAGRRGGGRR